MDNFVITEFVGAMLSKDPTGRKISFENRAYSCFIVTYKGSIRFSANDRVFMTDCNHSVFLPKGLTYLNECIDNAESYVFNFLTQSEYNEPIQLRGMDKSQIDVIYNNLKKLKDEQVLVGSNVGIFAELYLLAKNLFISDIIQGMTEGVDPACG